MRKNRKKTRGSARSCTTSVAVGNRGLRRSIARARMEAAGIEHINKRVKAQEETKYKSRFSRLWRKYSILLGRQSKPMRRIGKKGRSRFIAA